MKKKPNIHSGEPTGEEAAGPDPGRSDGGRGAAQGEREEGARGLPVPHQEIQGPQERERRRGPGARFKRI